MQEEKTQPSSSALRYSQNCDLQSGSIYRFPCQVVNLGKRDKCNSLA